jgi:phosphoenolpyruvate synthase/pyruvate phosphate dikinase
MGALEKYRYGGKAASLLALKSEGFNVPAFIVLTEKTQQTISETQLLEWVEKELQGEYFAVRSSANLEDGEEQSFAGVFTTKLFVAKSDLLKAVGDVANAKNSNTVAVYVAQNKIDAHDLRLSIIIQEMISAEVSGVAFSCNPLKPYKKEIIVSSVFGLGEGLVSGELNADHFTFYKNQWKSEIADKEKQLIFSGKTVEYQELSDEQRHKETLNKSQLIEIKDAVLQLEKTYDSPQDVEFCFALNKLYILQSRPITTIDKHAEHIIWDNSNIIESYPGITSPFTFSFILAIYESVYKNFALLLGVSPKQLKANAAVFAEMLGHINGRVYYQLINWYKALAMLPAYQLNAQYMENMMGVSEPLGVEFKLKAQPGKLASVFQVIKTIVRILWMNYRLPKIKAKFTARVNKIIADYKKIDYSNLGVKEIWVDYQEFKTVLVSQWSPPLANDLLAMIYFGSLQKICTKWLHLPQLHAQLVVGKYAVKSVLPAKLLSEICEKAEEEGRMESIRNQQESEIWKQVQAQGFGETGNLIAKYIELYGDRSVGELKLENETFTQNPEAFITILKSYKVKAKSNFKSKSFDLSEYSAKLSFVKRIVFEHVVNKSAQLVSDRENLRFDRTLAFGIIRKFMWAIGKKMEQDGALNSFKDVFYLKEEELNNWITKKLNNAQIAEIIQARKVEFKRFETLPIPPERVHQYNGSYDLEAEPKIAVDGLRGIPCCAGIVEGRVRIVSKPEDVKSLEGDILVTSSTDPGWITIFQSASAILVERGSTLSHAAIVSREMGIPCIVGIKGITQALKTGDRVKMNGLTGIVEKVDG